VVRKIALADASAVEETAQQLNRDTADPCDVALESSFGRSHVTSRW
jgi:hypothetical protein